LPPEGFRAIFSLEKEVSMDLKITPNAPSKLTGMDKSRLPGVFAAIITVNEEGYTPPSVELRGRIAENMITANVSRDALAELEADPKVTSVAVAKEVKPI
jgi:hypothetical protein